MTETVRVPDPVFERISRRAENRDVPNGVVVEEWMKKAEKFDQMEEQHGQ